jgi:hypothetical protein
MAVQAALIAFVAQIDLQGIKRKTVDCREIGGAK